MTKPSLRSVLETAAADIRTYRDPDVSEAGKRLDAIVVAAGLGHIGSDRVARIGIGDGYVSVETEYSHRGCTSGDEFEIPVSIIDAPDPVIAATRWGLERKRAEAVREIEQGRRSLAEWEASLADVEAKLAAA